MRYFPIVLLLTMTGCAQLMHGQFPEPVEINAKLHLMSVDCSGPANDWTTCHAAAGNSCEHGYSVADRHESSNGGRVLDYQCK